MQIKHILANNKKHTFQWRRHLTLDHRQRLSRQFLPLKKDNNSTFTENASVSHAYLLQGGFIRQSSSGIFSLLPMGLRVIDKIEAIIEEEMDAIGSQKLRLPLLLQSDHWKKTGRWDTSKGEFFRLKDRKDVDMLLAPTHEEEITTLVASELRSSKQLPIRLYQIGRKYRDELRPRAGLLRGREFIMKDLYSFDKSAEDAFLTYDQVSDSYTKIFNKIGIPFVVAEADSGNIGGSKSHEYHLISPAGEDTLLTCQQCGYTANEELAEGVYKKDHDITNNLQQQEVNNNIVSVLGSLDTNISSILSTNQLSLFSYASNSNNNDNDNDNKDNDNKINGLAVVITPKNRNYNYLKIHSALGSYLETNGIIHDRATLELDTNLSAHWESTYSQHNSHQQPIHIFIDNSLKDSLYTPLSSISPSSKFIIHPPHHFRLAEAGDGCSRCIKNNNKESSLQSVKAIEVGHTFYLGTKYSSVLGCEFQDSTLKKGKHEWHSAEMGCYGIGISRLLASVAETRTDERGLIWPIAIAPYKVCIITTDDKKKELKELSNNIYDQLEERKPAWQRDIIIDDRQNMGFGRKMTDAELMGYPWIMVVGKKALDPINPKIEIHQRVQNDVNKKLEISLNEFNDWIALQ